MELEDLASPMLARMTRDHPGMLVQKQLIVNELNWD